MAVATVTGGRRYGHLRSPPTVTYGHHLRAPAGYKEASASKRLRAFSSALAEMPLLHDPGQDFLYSVQFDVLGRLLELAAGEGRELEEHIKSKGA